MKYLTRIIVGLVIGLASGQTARAQVPHLIRYQGQAVASDGVPLEGPYDVTFRLYNAETVGTVVWQERHERVQVTEGHFSILLGQGVLAPGSPPLGAIDWTQPCWISIQVNGESELAPRQRITSVPMAITAKRLEAPLTTSTITDDSNALVPSGAVILWMSAACPAGYTRVSALDGKFLVGAATYSAAAGGSHTITPAGTNTNESSHTHGDAHGHDSTGTALGGGSQCSNGDGGGCQTVNQSTSTTGSGSAHTHTFTGTPFDNRPAFATILLCQKD